MQDEHKAMLDGTRASCVLASIFAVVTFAVALCDRKYGAVMTSFLVGEYDSHTAMSSSAVTHSTRTYPVPFHPCRAVTND